MDADVSGSRLKVAVVDYGLGNLRSVAGAVERLGHQPIVSSTAKDLEQADRLILPGVGAFGDGMSNLAERGLVDVLTRLVRGERKPVLGICLGAELMARESDEFGHHAGLAWIEGSVKRIAPVDATLRIPHVGWNAVTQTRGSRLFGNVSDGALFYFVHSYHVECDRGDLAVAETEYGCRITAAIECGNIYGTQFHPEKSQRNGLEVLRNFLERAGSGC